MKRASEMNYKERFSEIAKILNIEFAQADELFFRLTQRTIDQNYDAMIEEEISEMENDEHAK